ncbi:hypothetical protein [Bacillus subtilis]|uniref:hypothetical protein n=1 Tax=Bacillus subtilis TaxID=1423 RepID=UPI0025CB1DE9|nr:hypothetical protein [Bacillus subtilis]WCS67947.1 hypothetical protein Goe26_00350 [Bacillus phage vB_BsuM-Goe26]GLI90536.1 hypothetical protein ANABIO4_38880 [Bacillus subtilis]
MTRLEVSKFVEEVLKNWANGEDATPEAEILRYVKNGEKLPTDLKEHLQKRLGEELNNRLERVLGEESDPEALKELGLYTAALNAF